MSIVLVCGGRDYNQFGHVAAVLTNVAWWIENYGDKRLCIVQGGAAGADKMARLWCANTGTPCLTMDAPWQALGKRAGSVRNGWMLEFLKVDRVLAFPGGVGTADMVRRANEARVVVEFQT